MNDKDVSDWMGDFGECKVCKGEIPHGHDPKCCIHKWQMMESERNELRTLTKKLIAAIKEVVESDDQAMVVLKEIGLPFNSRIVSVMKNALTIAQDAENKGLLK